MQVVTIVIDKKAIEYTDKRIHILQQNNKKYTIYVTILARSKNHYIYLQNYEFIELF